MSEDEYKITAAGYLERAMELRDQGGIRNLIYAAFEIRCALERTLVDYAVLIRHPKLPNDVIKPNAYKPRALLAVIRQAEPDFEKRLHFSHLLLRAGGKTKSQTKFDADWICKSHEALNQYVHHLKDPQDTVENTEWVSRLTTAVHDTSEHLLSMWRANKGYWKSPTPQGDDLYQLFCSGKYTDDEIIGMAKISDF